MKIPVLILEDESLASRMLLRQLESFPIEVLAVIDSVHNATKWFTENIAPPLIFSDIQLSDGISFELFEKLPEIQSHIIFTTAYDEYAIRAFKWNSLDYLLKPIDELELKKAFLKFIKYQQQSSFLSYSEIFNQKKDKHFSVKVGNSMKIVKYEDVVIFYSENKGTYVETVEKKNFLTDFSLDDWSLKLSKDDFFRINRQVILSIHHIKEIKVFSNSRLKIEMQISTSNELIVSRDRVSDFKYWINSK